MDEDEDDLYGTTNGQTTTNGAPTQQNSYDQAGGEEGEAIEEDSDSVCSEGEIYSSDFGSYIQDIDIITEREPGSTKQETTSSVDSLCSHCQTRG